MYVVNSSGTSDESKPKSDQIENKLETACQKSIVSIHNKLVLHNKIGEGLYSHVFVGSFKTKEKNIADRFAVKISDKCKDKNLFLQEVQALFKMKNCQFIIDIITYYTHKNIPYLLLELGDIDLGNLFEIMIKKNIQLSYGNIKFMLDNLSRAAETMLNFQIEHDDLAPSNIIYFFNQGILKVSDFNGVNFSITTKNKLIRDIASMIIFAKLRFDHHCLAQSIVLCDTCINTSLSDFTENTNWEDTRLYSIIKKMRSETPEEHINPKEIYNKLTLLEPLPMMLE